MPTTSIKISQLDPITSLTGSDFFPIDQSSSIKTYRASLTQLQNLFSTGSFTGSFTGSILGTGTSPQFVGTSSWAISSGISISSSYSDFSNSSSYALSSSRSTTASYALNSNAGDLSGAGTTNYIPIWTGNKTLGSTSDFYSETSGGVPYFTSTRDLKIQKASPALFVTGSGLGYVAVRAEYNSSLMLQSAQSASQDGWSLILSADGANAAPGNPYDIRGRLDLTSISASSQFFSKQVTGESTPITYVLSTRSNGLYYWPLPGAQSLSRDGTFNIGVDTANPNTDTRLKIQVFSGSSAANPQTYHIRKAIEVTYGSGSTLNTTFCVSSSGQVIATGYSGSNFNAVSFYGSASYALSSSNAVTASYTLSSSYALTSSNAVTASYAISMIPLENTSTATLSGFLGGTNEGGVGTYCYAIAHGFGVTPSWIRSTLYCVTGDAGYVTGDEVDLNAVEQDELDANVFTTWTNSTYAAISVAGNTAWPDDLYIPNKTGGTWTLMVPANWKYKIRVLK